MNTRKEVGPHVPYPVKNKEVQTTNLNESIIKVMDQSQKIEGKVFLTNDSLSLHTLVIAKVKNQHMSL